MGKFIRMQYRTLYQRIIRKLRPVWGRIMGAPNFSIIVFQMGKVGSKTVEESLIRAYKKNWQPVDVYHSHILCGFDEAERTIRNERPNPKPSLIAIAYGRTLAKLIEKEPKRQWKIISLVRDPVARNMATFFENLHEFVPDWDEQKENDPLLMQRLQDAFLNIQTIHSEPYRWFDEQLLPVFGVDVFSEPFPRDTGYKIYNANSRISIMIIRLEDLDRIAPLAMKEFLGLDNFKLFNSNLGSGKVYAELYARFKKYHLPDDYIRKMYDTKFARTFYTEADIAKFTTKWTKVIKNNNHKPFIKSDPIIVYQMGKVGSKSVELSLINYYQKYGIDTEIYHAHFLNYLDEMEKNAVANRLSPHSIKKIHDAQDLLNKIKEDPHQKWNLISLVRDPVSRNIAGFFQNLSVNQLVHDWKERYMKGRLKLQDLQDIFLNLPQDFSQLPSIWFDTQVKSVFDIDVYSTPFPFKNGYKIYKTQSKNIQLLILRSEDLNKCATQALHEYLDFKNFTILNTNVGAEKDYASIYEAFKQLPFPTQYVEKIYDTKFVKHFYNEAEIKAFKHKWTKK